MRISHKTSPRYAKKFSSNRISLGHTLSIRKLNENQLELLMIINKQLLMRMSRQSQVNLKSRTQSTTIPNTLIAKGLYIYKKWKCVESLTLSGSWLTSPKGRGMIGTSITYIAYWTHTNLVNRRDGEIYTETLKGGVTGGLDRPLKADKDLANQFYLPSL